MKESDESDFSLAPRSTEYREDRAKNVVVPL